MEAPSTMADAGSNPAPTSITPPALGPKPPWLRIRVRDSEGFRELKQLARGLHLTTVCEEAKCPNIFECWGQHRTATFMLFGDTCTRACGFCAVKTGLPGALDRTEPDHVAHAVLALGLKHAVITSVNRDDLADGGAQHFATTIEKVREANPYTRIEVLIPDFKGKPELLAILMAARPEVLAHNTETVPRLYRTVRPGSLYKRSLQVLKWAAEYASSSYPVVTKTGIMCGLGESKEEIVAVMDELRDAAVDVLTLGQYLQPSREHLPVVRHYHPDEFGELRAIGLEKGFKHVEAGPLVRSSYHAHEHVPVLSV